MPRRKKAEPAPAPEPKEPVSDEELKVLYDTGDLFLQASSNLCSAESFEICNAIACLLAAYSSSLQPTVAKPSPRFLKGVRKARESVQKMVASQVGNQELLKVSMHLASLLLDEGRDGSEG